MEILMLGWEYPPLKSGGLGTACYGLTKAISKYGHRVKFVLPRMIKSSLSEHLEVLMTDRVEINNNEIECYEVDSLLSPYLNEESYARVYSQIQARLVEKGENIDFKNIYGRNLFEEVARFTLAAQKIAQMVSFDIIVAHDWLTFDAGLAVARQSGKSLVVHIHATEADRTGGHPNQLIYDIEHCGLSGADRVITNSRITMENCFREYGVSMEKMVPIYLAIDQEDIHHEPVEKKIGEKLVVFVGRITLQKGPEYFIEAAKKVLQIYPAARFIMAGDGDKFGETIQRVSAAGLGDRILFTGFLSSEETYKLMKMADLYVMTSVAEPFGLTVLEALRHGTPCIIPNNAGVAEVLQHVIKCNFWDIDELTNAIISVLRYPALQQEMMSNAHHDIKNLTWDNTARETLAVYKKAIKERNKVYV